MPPIRSASPLTIALTVIVGTVLIGIDMTIVRIAPEVAQVVQSARWVPVALMAAALIAASVTLWNARAPQKTDASATEPSTSLENA